MLKSLSRFLRDHPVFIRVLVLGYTAFLCCFFFPLAARHLCTRSFSLA